MAKHESHGKWAQPGIPHKGWDWHGVHDLGEHAPTQECEMCERQQIRFVHTLAHPDYPDILECGCVCAGYMTDDPAGATRREAVVRYRAKRRSSWTASGWGRTHAGSPMRATGGYHITIWHFDALWQFKLTTPSSQIVMRRGYASEDAAKLAAFDAMVADQDGLSVASDDIDTRARAAGRRLIADMKEEGLKRHLEALSPDELAQLAALSDDELVARFVGGGG